MKTQIVNTPMMQEVKEIAAALFTQTRSKIISAADVWNIQAPEKKPGTKKIRFIRIADFGMAELGDFL